LAFLRCMEASSTSQFDRFSYTCRSLFGVDISNQALDAAAFVLLRQCLSDARSQGVSPWAAWHSIRLNLVQVDALKIEAPNPKLSEQVAQAQKRLLIRRSELSSVPSRYYAAEMEPIVPIDSDQSRFGVLFVQASRQIGQVFPDAASGFDLVVGNPPYASLGERDDESWLVDNYQSLATVERSYNTFILFIEMMWRLTRAGSNASALVTPLSIAFHRGSQYQDCRRAMTLNGGRWQFAFFDRQPHALFGEEVKTRNAILFRSENSQTPSRGARAGIATGPLRKWTSRTRKYLFDNIDFVQLGDANIGRSIPKLQNESQARVFKTLSNRLERLPSLSSKIAKCLQSEIFNDYDFPRVFVGGTAYNFLNVYREFSINSEEPDLPLSESAIHCLEFYNHRDAQACFAILSSRLSFWLWHVLGDGFHVASWLFNEIPVGRKTFSEDEYDSLSTMGNDLWEKLKKHRFTSLNGGKRTIGFRLLACNQEVNAIDDLIIRTLGLPDSFKVELRAFVENNAVVDSNDQRRSHLQKYFSASQSK
jgi:Eco57I restriction-modification methylase